MSRSRLIAGAVAVLVGAAFYGWPLVAIAQRSLSGVAGRAGLSMRSVGDGFSVRPEKDPLTVSALAVRAQPS